jgi:alkaline phosphatase
MALLFQVPAVGDSIFQPVRAIAELALPLISLTQFGYSQAALDAAATHGLSSQDRPGIGSGLVHLGGNRALGITDRGPNFDHFPVNASCQQTSSTANGKVYPLPSFTPALVELQAAGNSLNLTRIINLVTPLLNPITGLPNEAGDEPGFADPCSTTTLPFNPNGMDVEDLDLLPNGRIIGVEENKPSIFIADTTTGIVEMRYTPAGKTLAGAEYPVVDALPGILAQRRNNRGFEAVSVTPDGRTAFTLTQSPLGPTTAGTPTRDSRVLRILRLDVSNPFDLRVTGQFIFLMSPNTAYPAGVNQRDLKLSAMTWIGPDRLLLLERSDEVARGGVRLILVDLANATNIHGLPGADTLQPEDVGTNLTALGVVPVTSTVVFQELETQANRVFFGYKLEGLDVVGPGQVAIINDNDFGIGVPLNAPTHLWVLSEP